MHDRIARYFDFGRHDTSFRTEFIAGLSTFLSLSYIFVVNPSILSQGGMNKSMVLFATIITSSFATFLMGIWAKKPFVLAPGLEMNSYVAFFVIGTLGFTWQQSLGACFWSAIIFVVLTLTNIRYKIIEAIPNQLKIGLTAAVGVFLIIIALRLAGFIVYEGIELKGVGSFASTKAATLYIGLMLVLLFSRLKFPASVLFSIIIASVLAFYLGIKNQNNEHIIINNDTLRSLFKLDIGVITNPKIYSAIIILFLIDFYGSVAKMIGLTYRTTIINHLGNVPKMKEVLTVDGAGSIIGAALGTTCITIFVESGVGIGVGGRTGLTAIVCSVFMLLFLPLAPILNYIPVEATTGPLFWVGLKLLPKKQDLNITNWEEIASIFVMIILIVLSFSLDKAMLFGFTSYILGKIITKKRKEVSLYLYLSTILLLIGILLN